MIDPSVGTAEHTETTGQLLDAAGAAFPVRVAVVLAAIQMMLEVFDFYIIGFLVSVIGPAWNLTYGQSSIILLAGGLGAIVGALLFGELADRIGRKPVIVGCSSAVGICAGLIALVPEGNWQLFAALRVVLGIGFGGSGVAIITCISEVVPRHRRILAGGLVQLGPSLGVLLGALSSSMLLPMIGWRGLAALGTLPVVVAGCQLLWSPESIRWQLSTNRLARARRSLESLLGRQIDEHVLQWDAVTAAPRKMRLRALFDHPRLCLLVILAFFGAAVAVNGVLLWGPALFTSLLKISPAEIARAFVLVSIVGFLGRITFTYLPQRIGRRRAAEVMGYGGAAFLALAAFGHGDSIAGVSVLLLAIVCSAFFFDGGFANMQPYVPELFSEQLAATATGLSQVASGTAKVLAPFLIALITGFDTIISPSATKQAVVPVMLCLASGMLLTGLSFTLLGGGLSVQTPAAGRGRGQLVATSKIRTADGCAHETTRPRLEGVDRAG